MKKKFNFIDMTGWVMKEHGVPNSRLTVIELADPYISPNDHHKRQRWKCKCECGTEFITLGNRIRSGVTLSCGKCNRFLSDDTKKKISEKNKTHGESATRLYKIWRGMKVRCYLKTDQHYPDYGARGIVMCDEWSNSYESFRDWAYINGYQENLTIDRVDVDGNYEPSNCRWATVKEQANNKRDTIYLTYDGERKSLCEWASEIGMKEGTLRARVERYSYTDEEALTRKLESFRNKPRKKI